MSGLGGKLNRKRGIVSGLGAAAVVVAVAGSAPAQLRQRVSNQTPNGDTLSNTSSQFADIGQGTSEEAVLALNGQAAILITPGDAGILQLHDQDTFDSGGDSEHIRFEGGDIDTSLVFSARTGDTDPRRIRNENQSDLELRTDGAFLNFYTDFDNDTVQSDVGRWFNNGSALTNRIFQIDAAGNVEIDGTLTENVAFDLAEAFLKTEAIEAGQLIAVDESRFDGVRLTHGVNDRAVIGVASTKPGIILGGGAFSVDRIAENWGDEHAARFRAEQLTLQERVLREREDLQDLQQRIESLAKYSVGRFGFAVDESMVVQDGPPRDPQGPRTVKRRDWINLQAAYARDQARFADELEAAAIDLFLEETLVPVALAGRVPVQVDGRYGRIIAGDYLAPSPIPGVAMKARYAGPTVGVALESFDGERGLVRMLVQRGWFGGDATEPNPTPDGEELASVATTTTTAAVDQAVSFQQSQQQNADLMRRLLVLEQRLDAAAAPDGSACQ